jgi:hypothetical protein
MDSMRFTTKDIYHDASVFSHEQTRVPSLGFGNFKGHRFASVYNFCVMVVLYFLKWNVTRKLKYFISLLKELSVC